MVESEFSVTGPPRAQVVIRPNQSWTWRANLAFLAVLMFISFSIAIFFTVQGYWVILPFSILEMSLLGGCLWYCVARGYRQEVVTLAPLTVKFERGRIAPEPIVTLKRQFDRYFARFEVEAPMYRFRDKRIALRCRDERYEIGSFLNAEEKDQLVTTLRRGIRHVEHDAGTA